MSTNSQHTDARSSDSLRELWRLNRQSQEIYHYSAEQVETVGIQEAFRLIADERETQARDLDQWSDGASQEPSPPFNANDPLHPCWEGVKEALGGHDEYLALEELEMGESCIEAMYQATIATELLPLARSLAERHLIAIATTHARIRNLRDAAKPRL